MAVEQAALLVREGCKVHMFSAQELAVPDMKYYRGDGGELTLQPLDMAYWTNILPAGVDIAVSDSRFSITRRWRDMLPVLANFNPDVVLLVGLYSPLAAALHTVCPVVGLSVNSVPPIAPMDVWLSADAPEKMQEASSVWSGAFPSPPSPSQPVFHPWRVTHTRAPGRLTRAEFFSSLGLGQSNNSNNAVIWVTVGFRLQYEVGGEWAARMLELLSRYSNVFWILVGGDASLPPALRHAPTDRVRALPTRSDISDILRVCDIYVNPPRMGGGFSVVEAMAEGLPVTAFAGSDGGDKVGELALCEMDGYMQRLAALTETPALRVEMGQALRQRFVERFDLQSSGPALLAACHKACELAASRLTTSAS
jgi:glycosyltransferase involved in cell wall biosynthesis